MSRNAAMVRSARRVPRARPNNPKNIRSEIAAVSDSLVRALLRVPGLAAEQGRDHDNRKSKREPTPNPIMERHARHRSPLTTAGRVARSCSIFLPEYSVWNATWRVPNSTKTAGSINYTRTEADAMPSQARPPRYVMSDRSVWQDYCDAVPATAMIEYGRRSYAEPTPTRRGCHDSSGT
jgi:hypothetical protein